MRSKTSQSFKQRGLQHGQAAQETKEQLLNTRFHLVKIIFYYLVVFLACNK